MGVADYGVNGGSSYSYTAAEFVSWANFTALSLGSSNKHSGAASMSIQQNLVDYNVYEKGHSGEYWAQDVPVLKQAGAGVFKVQLVDNIWNFSSPKARMAGPVAGNQLGLCKSSGGAPTYYYCTASLSLTVALPMEIKMVTVTTTATSGASSVEFGIWVYHAGVLVNGEFYDQVSFSGSAASAPAFLVGGTNPLGLYNDAETVLCGPGGGKSIVISSISARMSESYAISPSSSALTPVPHAWSAGADTAETVSGVVMSSPSSGFGQANTGTDNNIQLW
jgi:hypothetical protein